MQELMERLSWIKLGVSGELLELAAIGVAIDEANCSIAIAEVIGMKPLIGRLEFIRDYLAGEHSDRKAAMDRMIECLAIAEALPEIAIAVAPACLCPDGGKGNWFNPACPYHCDTGPRLSGPPARERSVPQRVTFLPDRDGKCTIAFTGDGLKGFDRDGSITSELTFSAGDQMELFYPGETVRVVNPADPAQWIDIQTIGVRFREPPGGEDEPGD